VLPPDAPVHIHIAEQLAEVDDCIATRGARPVQWLLDHANVDARWTLVHATHLDDVEIAAIAASRATVAICPTTEANLGDGLFPLRAFLDAGGRFGIGSDSHVSVSPVEELRWLEYGQRLVTHRRNVAVGASTSVGETLLAQVFDCAADSTGQAVDGDRVVLDAEHPLLAGATADDAVDRWVFAGNRALVRDVDVATRAVVRDGRHAARDAIAARYGRAIERLLG
jgi:formimidoylglutamate deiminase